MSLLNKIYKRLNLKNVQEKTQENVQENSLVQETITIPIQETQKPTSSREKWKKKLQEEISI